MLSTEDLTNFLNGSARDGRRPRGGRAFYGSIGASQAGNDCDALLALSLRGFPGDPVKPGLARIFRLGHPIEDQVDLDIEQVVSDLQSMGMTVEFLAKDELTMRQFKWSSHGGHALAKADGILVWNSGAGEIVEIKSMKEVLFRKFLKHGVAVSHPKYYDQCQMLMGLSGLRSSLVIGYNKNDSTYHVERVAFDAERWLVMQSRIDSAMQGAGERISEDPEDFRCRGCFKFTACRETWLPEWGVPECMHCEHSHPDLDRRWWCKKHDRFADKTCIDFNFWTPRSC